MFGSKDRDLVIAAGEPHSAPKARVVTARSISTMPARKAKPPERRAMGALETEVLSALWSLSNGGTPGEVCEAMQTDLAYTTVMTILTRLWQKELVDRTREGRAFRYRPLLSEAELAAQRMQALLTSAGDRKAALSQFVESLNSRDARVLRRALDDLDRES